MGDFAFFFSFVLFITFIIVALTLSVISDVDISDELVSFHNYFCVRVCMAGERLVSCP